MKIISSLSHTVWDCKYHVWIPPGQNHARYNYLKLQDKVKIVKIKIFNNINCIQLFMLLPCWIPKCRRKILYEKLRHYLGDVFHELARQRESQIIEGHLCVDHIHMCIAIPPKYSVVGYIKGKSAIVISKMFKEWQENL